MLGKQLKMLREINEKSQQEVCSALNIEQSTLANYENNKRIPKLEILIKLAEYYNVSVDYLLCRTNTNDDIEQEEPFYTNSRERKLIELYREYEDNDFSETIREGLKEFFPELVFGEELCPNEEKILSTFRDLNEDCQDIVIGKAKELLREQRYEESVAANSSMRKAK